MNCNSNANFSVPNKPSSSIIRFYKKVFGKVAIKYTYVGDWVHAIRGLLELEKKKINSIPFSK